MNVLHRPFPFFRHNVALGHEPKRLFTVVQQPLKKNKRWDREEEAIVAIVLFSVEIRREEDWPGEWINYRRRRTCVLQ